MDKIKTKLDNWLKLLLDNNGSVLHIKNSSYVKGRVQNQLKIIDKTPINNDVLKHILKLLVSNNIKQLMEDKEYEGIYKISSNYRFKYRIYTHQNGYAIVFKALPSKIKTFKELHLPSTLNNLISLEHGLIIISGDNSSGKSTLLASIVNSINNSYNHHIITLEDQIEYIYNDAKSMIEQKEINTHTKDTSKAIQSIIKEDPDIIVIDKLTDSIVAKYVIDLINRGYFIILTMNASNTQDTISKFLEFFESDIQEHIRHTLAYKLRAIISQELIINKDNNLIPVVEVMYQTENITNAILNQLDEQITDIIKQDSKTYDSITFEQSFQKLYTAGQVKKEALCSNLLKEEKRKATAKKSDNIVMIDDSTTITYSIRDEE